MAIASHDYLGGMFYSHVLSMAGPGVVSGVKLKQRYALLMVCVFGLSGSILPTPDMGLPAMYVM